MKASELIEELQRQITTVGDKEVQLWNVENKYYVSISSVYSVSGYIDSICIDGEDIYDD